jgi:UDP-2,3-diacylglucosamine hydrolase
VALASEMTAGRDTLGIVAGGGELPVAIAQAAHAAGRAVFVVALEGNAKPEEFGAFAHEWASLGQLGRMLSLLKRAGCSEVTMAGTVKRPSVAQLKLDGRGAMALPRVLAAATKGDDALLRAVLDLFEEDGFRVIGAAEAAGRLLAPEGVLGGLQPSAEDQADIALGARVVGALGTLDIGQGAVVCRGLTLAVEAAEGTDAMLSRVAELPQSLRGSADERKGVLVKCAKCHQDRRVDLPVIGARTVELAAAAGLAGIAVEAGVALILDRTGACAAADRLGLFLTGFRAKENAR